MSKYHYIITSKKKLFEETESDDIKKVIIQKVTKIEENHQKLYSSGNITNGKNDPFFNILMTIAVLMCLLMSSILILGKDF